MRPTLAGFIRGFAVKKVTLDGQCEPGHGGKIDTESVKAVCDSGNQ